MARPERGGHRSGGRKNGRARRRVWLALCAASLVALLAGGAVWLGSGAKGRTEPVPVAEVYAPAAAEAGEPAAVAPETEIAEAVEPEATPAPTPEPTSTPAPVVDITPRATVLVDNGESLTGKLWLNGSLEPVVLEAGKRRAQLAWNAPLEPASWRLVIYNSRNEIVIDQLFDGATRGILLNCADFPEDEYLAVVTAEAERDGARVQLAARNSFELRGSHETFGARIACSQQILAYIDGQNRVRLGSGITGIEGEAMLGEGVDWQGLENAVQVAVGGNHVVGLTRAGTVLGAGGNGSGQLDCVGLEAVRQIAAGESCTACVMDNGMVRLFGIFSDAQYELSQVENADSVSISQSHVIVLLRDGTARAFPLYDTAAPVDVGGWTALTQVSAGYDYCLGLRQDGSVVYAGPEDGPCAAAARWTDIAALSAGNGYALGAKTDGTAVSVGNPALGFVDVRSWTDIVDVAAGFTLCAGLHTDGSLVLAAQ